MKPIFLSLVLLTSAASGKLVITEVMAASSHPAKVAPTPDADGDWWELTNTGTAAVDLTGYKWDDTPTPATPTLSYFPPGIIIKAGESIIILEEPAANVATWKAAWGLGTSTQVVNRDQFKKMGAEGFSGLSTADDEVNLYDVKGSLVAHVKFGASVIGRSQAFHRDGTPIHALHSRPGYHGAKSSKLSPSDVASPGNVRLRFTTSPVMFGRSSYRYAVAATFPGGTTPVLSATGLPSFLTFTAGRNGTGVLASNRALTLQDADGYLIEILATSGTTKTKQQFLLTTLNPSPSVILNEYNAVAPGNFLNGGTAVRDADGGPASVDTMFGRVAGNGGRWVELVVVGEGGTGAVDMRGWILEIGTNSGSGFAVRNSLILSNAFNWQAVPSGTILTFIDKNSAQGGRNSGFAVRDRRTTVGDIWSNVWMGDPACISYTSPAVNGYTLARGVVTGIAIDHKNTQFRIIDRSDRIVFGPAGEGVAPLSGTTSYEIFELEGDPTPSVSPIVVPTATSAGYDDGASESTFGFPNNWHIGSTRTTQRFKNLTAPEIIVEQPLNVELTDGDTRSFGSLEVGKSLSRTFTIRNSGTATLKGLSISIKGTHAADFTVTASPAAQLPVGSATTKFTVRFAPSAKGLRTATFYLANNDADEAPFDTKLVGKGIAPEITVQQPLGSNLTDGLSKKSFGTVTIGKTSTSKTFTIKNIGNANLTGLAITKSGSHPKDFVVTAPAQTTLTPGTSTTFKVSFKPTAAGTRSAAIHLKSNDADENPFDITLTGSAVK